MLDSNICVALINRRAPQALAHISHCKADEITISSITLSELKYGVENSVHKTRNIAALEKFLIGVEIMNYDQAAAEAYGKVRTHLRRKGTPIGPLDLLIGAHALSQNITLVTNNTREFKRIPGLAIADWLR